MVALVVGTAVLLLLGGVALRWWSKKQLSESDALGAQQALRENPHDTTNATWATETDRLRNSGY